MGDNKLKEFLLIYKYFWFLIEMETNRTKIFPLHSNSNNNVYIDFQSTNRISTKDEDPLIFDKKVSL